MVKKKPKRLAASALAVRRCSAKALRSAAKAFCAKKNFPHKPLNAESRDCAATPLCYTVLRIRQKEVT